MQRETANMEECADYEKTFRKPNKAVATITEEDVFLLTQNSNENYIDTTKPLKKTVRLPITSASDKTIICLPKGSFFMNFNTAKELSLSEATKIIKDALLREGFDVTTDFEGPKGNDVFDSEGRKVSGVGKFEKNGVYTFPFFVANKNANNSQLSSYISYPEEYTERKEVDDASERFGYLEYFDWRSFSESLMKELQDSGFNVEMVESKPKAENPERYIEWDAE